MRRLQARENLKKLRGLVRRSQNRGYATLSRIAEHLDRLAIGDESNAAIDAVDAVSLMTVHAAKGLEFPVVFVVNMGRGTGNARAPIRVGLDAAGEASAAIADYQSESDEDAQAREREETKRLLAMYSRSARPFGAIGYREAAAVVAGELDLESAVTETKRRTRAYAKRQMTWLRAERNVHWLDASDPKTFEAAMELI